MAVYTVADLIRTLLQLELLDSEKMQEVQQNLGKGFRDPAALAAELSRRGWLTPYQVKYLAQGKGKHLALGQYRLIERLDEGPLGKTYMARHVAMDRVVALKVIPKERLANPKALELFVREARAVAQLQHPNIALAFDTDRCGNVQYFATEYVVGNDLAQLVQKHGPMPVHLAVEFIRQAALGLQHAHERGVLHRNIRPANLLATTPTPGAPPVVKIADFCMSRLENEEMAQPGRAGKLGDLLNRVDYLAPEQAGNPNAADHRADIYGLGCTLFFVLTGRPPYVGGDLVQRALVRAQTDAPPVNQFRPDVSPALAGVVARMLARDPGQRFQSAGEVAHALAWTMGQAAPPTPMAPVAAPVAPMPPPQAWAAPPAAAPTWQEVPQHEIAAAPIIPSNPAIQSPFQDHPAEEADDWNSMARRKRRPQGGNQKLIVVSVVALVAVGGVGAGIFFLTRGSNAPKPSPAEVVRNDPPTPTPTPTPMPTRPRPTIMDKPPEPMPMPMPTPNEMPAMPAEALPVPDEDAQAKALATIMEVYKEDYAKKMPIDMMLLSAKLQEKALETMDDPAAKFVLFREAANVAAQANEMSAAFQIADDLMSSFMVNPIETKISILEVGARAATNPMTNRTLLTSILEVESQAVAADDFEHADQLLKMAEATVPKIFMPQLNTQVQNRRKDLEFVMQEFEKVQAALKTLESNADDPAANLAVGRFWCLVKGDFEQGLPLLLQASDKKLKELAEKDLASPGDPAMQIEVADGWYGLAPSEDGLTKNNALRRAYFWYEQAKPGATGAMLTLVEARLKEIGDKVPGIRGRWDHLDLAEVKVFDDFVRIDGVKKSLVTKESYPNKGIDILLVARSPMTQIELAAFSGYLLLNGEKKPLDARLQRPDGNKTKPLPLPTLRSIAANTWHSYRWRITDKVMELYFDNRLVLREKGNYVLSDEAVRVIGGDSPIDVRTLTVTPIK